jgi:hypothetical protein
MKVNDIVLQSGSLSSSLDGGQTTYTINFPENSLINESISNDKIRWILKYEGPTGIPSEEGMLMEIESSDLTEIISSGGDCSVEVKYDKVIYAESSSGSMGYLPEHMRNVEYDPTTATGSFSASIEEVRDYVNPSLRLVDGYCVIHTA